MVEFTLTALKSEIETDPKSLGYKEVGGQWKGDSVIADLLNEKNLVVDRISVGMEAIRQTVFYDWYNGLGIDEQEFLRWQTPNGGLWKVTADMKLGLCGRDLTIDGVAGAVSAANSWWAPADRTEAESPLLALLEVPGSRAEVLWGEGRTITAGNVGAAQNV